MSSGVKLLLVLVVGWLSSGAAAEEIWVTGRPASVEFLRRTLEEFGWSSFPSHPLEPGACWEDDPGNRVINLDWSPPEASVTALSDHPEKVETRGGLFFGGLTRLRPLNFQYYHLGKLTGPSPNLTLFLYNPGDREALVYVRAGVGRPSLDYFSSGHSNNVEWFTARSQGLGYFRSIGPGETVELFRQPLPPEHVVSGTLGMTQLEGPPLQFALVARRDVDERISLNNLLKDDDVHSRGFYPAATQVARRAFRVGREPLNVAVGAVRQQTFSGVRELRGDYGVTYGLELNLVNDTASPAEIELVFNPRGGAATATFMVDGELKEVGLTRAFQERPFHRIALRAGQSRKLYLETIPEGASSYPVRIVMRSITGTE